MNHLIFTMSFFFAAVCCASGGEADADLKRMQGSWQVVSLIEKGKEVPKSETEFLEVVILKDGFSVSDKGKIVVLYRIKLDPGKMPKAIDFVHLAGDNKDKTEPGIYSFEQDQLKLIMDEDRKGRPIVFAGKETASYSVLVLKKKAPAKEAKKEAK